MIKKFSKIKSQIYDKCSLEVSDFNLESESKEYEASHFKLNGLNVIYRNAKITPKKVGQFVTFWKRKLNGPIEPFDEQDSIDFFVVSVQNEKKFGQFVFPKAVLIKKGILSTINKEGKRAFRVYPIWDVAKNKQAESTQKWQLDYFYEINNFTNLNKVSDLYKNK